MLPWRWREREGRRESRMTWPLPRDLSCPIGDSSKVRYVMYVCTPKSPTIHDSFLYFVFFSHLLVTPPNPCSLDVWLITQLLVFLGSFLVRSVTLFVVHISGFPSLWWRYQLVDFPPVPRFFRTCFLWTHTVLLPPYIGPWSTAVLQDHPTPPTPYKSKPKQVPFGVLSNFVSHCISIRIF